MAQPFNYNIQQPDIAGSLMGGIQAGQGFAQQQKANAMAEQYSADLQNYLNNPTASGAAAMSVKYPAQRQAFKQAWDIQSKDQQDSQFRAGTQVYSAIQSGKPDIAKGILDQQIQAMENSGQDPSSLVQIRDSLERDPKLTGAQIGLTLSALDPEKWGKIASELRSAEIAPSELTASQAKAAKAAVDAKYAESKAVQDLAKGGWEISKMQNDIQVSRQNSQIAALNANIARESNDLKRQALQQKVQDAQMKRDETIRGKAAEVESSRATIDNMLNTADRVLKTPVGVIESAAGPISSRLPTGSQDTADFEELLTTLSSQAFMAQIPALKGMGALSNAEGEKLQASLQNLSLRQSPARLVENVREAQRLILKSRSNLAEKFGVPDVIPDTPSATPGPDDIDALLQKYGAQ
ncbi:hypothetical protein [Pseudomonas chlororaphis]|uniref:hypothetical protein n=1 Tax=Pseudomonas chlororaphis TaxID=587753 RepID=UPI000BE2E41A|nr:hypothetical protein [Pseudomonas chlororaphis]